MKIIATVRTLNEARNIERFCSAYQWADKVLVADGGSIDNTVSLAEKFNNVIVEPFHKRIQMNGGHWRNPASDHIMFLNDWAIDEDADWILFDDCDCVPNPTMQRLAREKLEKTPYVHVCAVRLYLWGEDKHFPKLAQPIGDGIWETSLWGWKPGSLTFHDNEHYIHEYSPVLGWDDRLNILPPSVLLHRPWPNEEEVQRKMKFYSESGEVPNMQHPLEFGGALKDLPEWALK